MAAPTAAGPANTAPIGEPPQPPSTSYAVALGQGGTATLTFAQPITNGPGYDFAVFGNGFSDGHPEWVKPAFVEVSSDGVNFFRFPVRLAHADHDPGRQLRGTRPTTFTTWPARTPRATARPLTSASWPAFRRS